MKMKRRNNSKSSVRDDILKAIQSSIILPNTLPLTEWTKQNVFLTNPPYSIGGFLDVTTSPYLIEPLKALDNDKVREVVVCGNPRGGKTLLAEAYLLYTIKESPADCWWAVHKDESIKAVMDVRLLPILESNGVKFTDDRFQKTQKFIKFPVGSLKLVGAQNATGMVQTAGRVLIGDEVHEWKDGILDQFRKRSDDFPHSKKILLISQASDAERDFHKAYLAGHQAEFGFVCPHCNFKQKYLFSYRFNDGKYGGLNWDKNDITKPKGVWDIERAALTAHYTCTNPECRHNFYDTAKERRQLLDGGCYIETNSNAPESIRSFSWNALATPNVSYIDLAREYLTADYNNDRGKHDQIRNFWKQRMSHFFSIGKIQGDSQGIVGDIDLDATGSVVGVPVMGVDSQKSSHPYVIVSFNTDKKEMQLITYGKADTFDEIEKIQLDNRVKHQRVCCDCRFQQSDNIFVEIAKRRRKTIGPNNQPIVNSWLGTFGIGNRKDNQWYHGKDKRTGVEIYKAYSPVKRIPIKFGTNQMIQGFLCPTISFANDPIKDVLGNLLSNSHPDWKLVISEAAKNDKDFMAQINNEKKIQITDTKGYQKWEWRKQPGENDYFDCLCLCVLRGMVLGYL
jgi:hypothetical protein